MADRYHRRGYPVRRSGWWVGDCRVRWWPVGIERTICACARAHLVSYAYACRERGGVCCRIGGSVGGRDGGGDDCGWSAGASANESCNYAGSRKRNWPFRCTAGYDRTCPACRACA